jgi:hypothetical protein
MTHWLGDQMPPRDSTTRMRRGSDKRILRVHLAHMARGLYLTPPRQALQRIAADLLIARHHGQP